MEGSGAETGRGSGEKASAVPNTLCFQRLWRLMAQEKESGRKSWELHRAKRLFTLFSLGKIFQKSKIDIS